MSNDHRLTDCTLTDKPGADTRPCLLCLGGQSCNCNYSSFTATNQYDLRNMVFFCVAKSFFLFRWPSGRTSWHCQRLEVFQSCSSALLLLLGAWKRGRGFGIGAEAARAAEAKRHRRELSCSLGRSQDGYGLSSTRPS